MHLVLLVVSAGAVLAVPVTRPAMSGPLWRVQRLGVPAPVRATFLRVALAAFAGFAVAGLITAVSPAFLAEITGSPGLLLPGVVVLAHFGASVVGQVVRYLVGLGAAAGVVGLRAAGVGFCVLVGAVALTALIGHLRAQRADRSHDRTIGSSET